MEENSEEIQELMRYYGFSEKEALASYHLIRAQEIFEELYAPPPEVRRPIAMLFQEIHYGTHFGALHNALGVRVLRRDYPEGWGRISGSEQGGQEQN